MKTAIVGAVLVVLSACSSAWAQPSAEDILKATGIRGGLVVHLGCGDGRLTAALKADDCFLVQGLDTDAANVARARAHFRSLGLRGRVTADVFDGRRLPYVDNLVNLLVIEDRGRLPMAEVVRVLCPGGVAVTLDSQAATRTPSRRAQPAGLTRQPSTLNSQPSTLNLFQKPWPDTIDDWTHYLHGPDNNAVAQDSVVARPRHFQWISEPRFSRSHDYLASVTGVVSCGGRLFYIVDTGSIAFAAASPRWRLIARDAFNGVKLWEREISQWEYHLRDFRSGPAAIARRLVASKDHVYVTLGYGEPAVALDARTGETVRTYAGTEGTQEILHWGGTLLLVLGESKPDWGAQEAKQIVSQEGYVPPFERYTPPARDKRVMAVDAATGELKWEAPQRYTRELMPSTLAASGGHVYFQNADGVVCLDATTGRLKWEVPRPVQRRRLAWSTPTLVVHDGVVYSADRGAVDTDGELLWIPSGGYHEYIRDEGIQGELIALDGETGERLWSCPAYESFNAPVDILITGGLLWTGRYAWGNDPGITEGRDPKTGEVRRRRPPDQEYTGRIGHARCHRAKATSNYLVMGRRGVELVDLETGHMDVDRWVRGICQYGVMPANGLLYAPPHSCACSTDHLLKCGFTALAPERKGETDDQPAESATLEKGPAFGFSAKGKPAAAEDDWPTYRHDGSRSGVTPAAVSHDLQARWTTELGGKLTSPAIADGVVLVAEIDAHRVHALDAATGRRLWSHQAAARIDSPPTIHTFVVPPSGGESGKRAGRGLGRKPPEGGTTNSLCLFGSADGWVYCLRLEDGELIWRFRPSARDRRIVVNGQLESAWPVSGNVLVLDGAAYFAAGRSSYVDGGMFLCKVDAATGQPLGVQKLDAEQQKKDKTTPSTGHLADVLSTDGQSLFMRSERFGLDLARQKDNVDHLWSSVGFLDDSWWHRTYWQVGSFMASGWGGWPKAGQQVPAGRLLVTDGTRVFGFGRNQYDRSGAHVGVDANDAWGPIAEGLGRWTHYRLFGATMDTPAEKRARRRAEEPAARRADWTRRVDVLCQAMVLAGDTLLVAGPPDDLKEIPHEPAEADTLAEAVEATHGGRLLLVSAEEGKTLADFELDSPPVFDGMAAAQGRLYLSTKDGQMVCMGPAK